MTKKFRQWAEAHPDEVRRWIITNDSHSLRPITVEKIRKEELVPVSANPDWIEKGFRDFLQGK